MVPTSTDGTENRHDASKGEKLSNTSLQFLMCTSGMGMCLAESIQIIEMKCLQISQVFCDHFCLYLVQNIYRCHID